MKILTLFFLFASLNLMAQETAVSRGGESSGGRFAAKFAVSVDFVSIGSGIDYSALDKVIEQISYDLRDDKIVRFSNLSFGFEGTRKICVEYKSLETASEISSLFSRYTANSKSTKVSMLGTCENFGKTK